MSLKKQLIIVMLLVGLLPFIIMGVMSYNAGSTAVSNEAYAKLTAVRELKLATLKQLFINRKADLETFSRTYAVKSFINDMDAIDASLHTDKMGRYPTSNPLVQKITAKYHSGFKKFVDSYGYYDAFIIDVDDGHVIYSVARESDYGANLKYGPLKTSGLGRLYEKIKESRKPCLVDMSSYEPSHGDPAMFMGMPAYDGDKIISVVAVQLSDKMISSVMENRAGMGETGEAYLIGQDKLMRSDSLADPTNHSLKASFANPQSGKVDTEAGNDALAGRVDTKILNTYNGDLVLSSYTKLDLSSIFNADFSWGLIVEIDKDEVFIPIDSLRNSALIMAAIFTVLIFTVSLFLGNTISKPIISAVEVIVEANSQIVSASDQIAVSSTSLADGASQQASSVEEISATVEETTSINEQNSENAREADILARDANDSASKGNAQVQTLMVSMKDITGSSQEIAKIIKTIDEIAFQTNLLALNAAVEAARAGEHGLGFAVVAEEVKNLAGRSARAAKETAEIIERSINQVRQGNDIAQKTDEAFSDIVIKIKKTSDLIGEIAISAKEQSEGMRQVSTAISQIDDVTQQNAAASEEAAAAAEELNAQANSMLDSVSEIANIVGVDVRAIQGTHNTAHIPVPHKPIQPIHARIEHKNIPTGVSRKGSTKAPSRKESAKSQTSHEEKIFPLDDEDLAEF